jgi:hypothetical protein
LVIANPPDDIRNTHCNARPYIAGAEVDHVPLKASRKAGPFDSWEAAAIDAPTNCAPYAADWKDCQ